MPKERQISGVGMGMGFAPTWLRQVSPPLLHKTTLTTEESFFHGNARFHGAGKIRPIHENATSESEFGHDNGLARNTGAAAKLKGPTDFYRGQGFYRSHYLKSTL